MKTLIAATLSTEQMRVVTKRLEAIQEELCQLLGKEVSLHIEVMELAAPLPAADFVAACLKALGQPADMLQGAERDRHVTDVRSMIAHLLKTYKGLSYERTAQAVGRDHHTTGMYLCQRHGDLIATDPAYRATFRLLWDTVKTHLPNQADDY